MKALLLLSVPAFLLGFLFRQQGATSSASVASRPALRTEPSPADDSSSTGFAVVELFTSEGCSSCPPADKFLNELVSDAAASNASVYPLAFHVDYWNRLGWQDRFSDPAYSDRQGMYARAMKLDGVYTPQMIVNGTAEFVGSDRERGEEEIAKGLKAKERIEVAFEIARDEKGLLQLNYRLGDAAAEARKGSPSKEKLLLNFALVERGLTTEVKRGENGGRTLRHENVVRSFVTVSPDGSGVTHLSLPDGVALDQSAVIGYVQDAATLKVLGAAKVKVQ